MKHLPPLVRQSLVGAFTRFHLSLATVSALAMLQFPLPAAAGLLARWQFDEMATGEAQTTAWDQTTNYWDLNLRKSTTPCDLHTTTGTGPSGLAGDRSLIANVYSFPGTPNGINGHGLLPNPQSEPMWQNLGAVTFCGWIKVDQVPYGGGTGSVRLLHWTGAEPVELWFPWASGQLALRVGGVDLFSTPTTPVSFITSADVGNWVFIAVTYTAGQTSGVKFYRGTTTTPVALFAEGGNTTVTGNIQNTGAGNLYLGNVSSLNRAFPGQIDDFRIYDSALTSVTALEAIRQSGLKPKELLSNPGFELRTGTNWTADGWWHVTYGGADYDYAYDTSVYHSGTASQKVIIESLPAGSGHIFKQDVRLRGGQTYEASVWVRSTATNPVRIRFYLRKADKWYEPFAVKTITLNSSWQKLTIRGGSPQDMDIYFGIALLTPGTVWLDDASLTEVTQAPGTREIVSSGVVPGSHFGIHINKLGSHHVWPAMGQKTVRLWNTGTRWGDLQQDLSNGSNPTHAWNNWTRFDMYLNHIYDNTTSPTVIYTLGIPPKWAVPAGSPITHVGQPAPAGYDLSIAAPANLSDWTAYVDKVARRIPFNDPANAHMKIKYWEIWNEVDVTGGNSNNDPRSYAGNMGQLVDLAASARTTLLNVDPTNKILSPNFTSSGLIALEEYLEANGGDSVDIWSIHAYNDSVEPERSRPFFAAVKDVLSRYPGQSAKPIWNTEGASRSPIAISPAESAGIVARTYTAQWLAGISNYDWYAWDIAWGINGINLNTIVWDDANDRWISSLTPDLTAAGFGYGRTVNWLSGANIVAKTITPSVTGGERWIVEITRSGTYRGYIVWDTGGDVTWTIPTAWGVTQQRVLTSDVVSPVSGGTNLTIGVAPVLLQKP